jgi:hypothetical protein
VHRLQTAEDPGQCLHRDPGDVVQRLLLRQVGTGCLRMKLETHRTRVSDPEAIPNDPCPDAAAGTELRDLFEEADRDIEEECELPQHLVRGHAARNAVVGILNCGAECEAHGFGRCCPGLLRVLSDDR